MTTPTENTKKQTTKKQDLSIGLLLLKLRTFIALIVLIVVFSIIAPNFLNLATMVLMTRHVAIYAFLAIGMTFVIITGGIDLSVGAIVGLTGMVAGLTELPEVAEEFGVRRRILNELHKICQTFSPIHEV